MLIRAHADYYPIDRIEPFWAWLFEQAKGGRVKMPLEIYDEVTGSKDLLGQWLQRPDVKRAIVLAEPRPTAPTCDRSSQPDMCLTSPTWSW